MATFRYQCTAPDAASCTSGTWVPDDVGLFGVSLSVDDAYAIAGPALALLAGAWVLKTLAGVIKET